MTCDAFALLLFDVVELFLEVEMDDDGTVTFEDTLATWETDKALRVKIDGEEYWVPRSVIHDNSEVYRKDHTGKLVVPEWWAIEKGLV